MERPSGSFRHRTLTGLLLVCCLLPAQGARGQERPPSGPSATQSGEAGRQTPAAPSAGAPSAGRSAPGAGATSAVPTPIFLDFPPPSVPAGEPIGPISPIRPLQFATLPEGGVPIQVRATLGVQEEYTDNANETKTNKVGMLRTSVNPGLSGHAEGSRSTVDLAYTPRILFQNAVSNQSANTAANTSVQHYLTTRGGFSPTPELQLNASEDFTNSTDFRAVGNLGTTQTGQNTYTINQATAEGAYVPAWGRLGLAYTNVLAQNDVANANNSLSHNVRASGDLNDPRYNLGGSYTLVRGLYSQASSNYWENGGEIHAKRVLTPTVSATISGQFTDHSADQPLNRNFTIAGGRVGGIWAYSPDGSISAQGGADIYSPQNAGSSVRPSAVARWTQRLTYVAVTAGFEQSFQQNFQSVDNTGVSLVRSASLYLTSLTLRDLTATVGGRWYWQQFQQNTASGGPSGTKQGTWDLQARLEYALLRSLVLALDYIYTIRSSTQPSAAFVENRASFSLSYRYDLF